MCRASLRNGTIPRAGSNRKPLTSLDLKEGGTQHFQNPGTERQVAGTFGEGTQAAYGDSSGR